MSFMEENGINLTFPIFLVHKSDRIAITEIVFSLIILYQLKFHCYTISKTQDIGLLVITIGLTGNN